MNFINGLSNKSSTSNFFTTKTKTGVTKKLTQTSIYKLLVAKYPLVGQNTKQIFVNALENANLLDDVRHILQIEDIIDSKVANKLLYNTVADIIMKNPNDFISFIDGKNVINDPKETSDGTITGFGIGNHTIPKQEAFGDIIISTYKLYYNNQLLVKDKKVTRYQE